VIGRRSGPQFSQVKNFSHSTLRETRWLQESHQMLVTQSDMFCGEYDYIF